MSKYRIYFDVVKTCVICVEANSPDEAKAKGEKLTEAELMEHLVEVNIHLDTWEKDDEDNCDGGPVIA